MEGDEKVVIEMGNQGWVKFMEFSLDKISLIENILKSKGEPFVEI